MNLEEQIRRQLNIVDVISEYMPLKKKGNNYWGLCPFHQDSNASMSVNPQKNIFKCFTCGTGGHVDEFVEYFEKISHGKALEKLASKLGIEVKKDESEVAKYSAPQQKLISLFKDASDFFQLMIASQDGENALKYAEKRGLDSSIREQFKIGYVSNHGLIEFLKAKGHDESDMINTSLMTSSGKQFYSDRLIYGITNPFGDIVAFSGRLLSGDGPKYINSAESLIFHKSSILYNYSNAKDAIQKEKEVYVLEGFMDVIAMHKIGYKNSVAIMGTALTKEHLVFLKGNSVHLMLDSDKAGIEASLKSIKLLLANKFTVKVVYNKEGKDADEILSSLGETRLKQVVASKISALEYVFEILKQKYSMNNLNDIELFLNDFTQYLSLTNDLEKDFYVNKIANEFKLSPQAISTKIPGHIKIFDNENKQPTTEIRVAPNHSYKLLKSLLVKPTLVSQLKKNPAHLNDPMLLSIAKYIVSMKEWAETKQGDKPIPDIETKEKVKEILSYNGDLVDTNEELDDLINLINKNGIETLIQGLIVKLNNATSDEEQDNLLNQINEAKKRKRKYGKSND